jgi:rhodanese-related sulfurtransferase
MARYLFVLVFVVACGMSLLFGQAALPAMTPREAAPQIAAGEMLLVDVRTPEEWRATGLARSAVPIDMRDPQFQAKLAQARRGREDKPVALICAGGVRSARVQASLAQISGIKTVNITGGMSGYGGRAGWIAEGLPVETAPK